MMVALIFGVSAFKLAVALAVGYGIVRVGLAMLRGLATPIPEPPPAGELRKVKIIYRCLVCGTEVRMTLSTDQEPEAPRHCMQEMDLLTPVE